MSDQNDLDKRELNLKELKTAVDSQIELWEAIERIRELIGCDCDPLNWVQNASIFADSGISRFRCKPGRAIPHNLLILRLPWPTHQ
jgi:hypothetical protein